MRVAVVIPVYNDWDSLSQLVSELDAVEVPENVRFFLFAVDDGSSEPPTIEAPVDSLHHIQEIEIIGLASNLGHQRAIAIGLVEVYR